MDLDQLAIEYIESRKREPCPDCGLRGDLLSYPDIQNNRPLKVKGWKQSRVKDCETCKGKAWVERGSWT